MAQSAVGVLSATVGFLSGGERLAVRCTVMNGICRTLNWDL